MSESGELVTKCINMYSLGVHSCTLRLNNIKFCSESMSAERMSLYETGSGQY